MLIQQDASREVVLLLERQPPYHVDFGMVLPAKREHLHSLVNDLLAVAARTDMIDVVDGQLILDGLRIIYERYKREQKE